jgi:hypothetical protein
LQTADYCRDVESYLCRKNDGHLIRVVGPSFDLVSGWAAQGVPIRIAFSGIDRCFERYHRKGGRRRPLKIDFCEADVLDAFDEWRRAIGLPTEATDVTEETRETTDPKRPTSSLPAHLERALLRLTSARARGTIGGEFDRVIDSIAGELDVARRATHGLRGEARKALLVRLSEVEAELLNTARAALDESMTATLRRQADVELAGFRDRMKPEALTRARELAFDRLLRDHFGLPALTFD